MTKIGTMNILRPYLKATLSEGSEGLELIIERKSTPMTRTAISLKADEW